MNVFRGWYRKSLARKGSVWHRVHQTDSLLAGQQRARTVCGRNISMVHCDFIIKPHQKCLQCEKSTWLIKTTGRVFNTVISTSVLTKSYVIRELKLLLKSRTYYVRIWGDKGVRIKAEWVSAMDIDISTYPETMVGRRKNKIMTLEQVHENLDCFKSDIIRLCGSADVLALKEKQKKKTKGKLTDYESYEYFEGLLKEAEE